MFETSYTRVFITSEGKASEYERIDVLRLAILLDDIQTYITTCTETLHWSAF
jgi:hypothetical protein